MSKRQQPITKLLGCIKCFDTRTSTQKIHTESLRWEGGGGLKKKEQPWVPSWLYMLCTFSDQIMITTSVFGIRKGKNMHGYCRTLLKKDGCKNKFPLSLPQPVRNGRKTRMLSFCQECYPLRITFLSSQMYF